MMKIIITNTDLSRNPKDYMFELIGLDDNKHETFCTNKQKGIKAIRNRHALKGKRIQIIDNTGYRIKRKIFIKDELKYEGYESELKEDCSGYKDIRFKNEKKCVDFLRKNHGYTYTIEHRYIKKISDECYYEFTITD